jgi:hypothetical protein
MSRRTKQENEAIAERAQQILAEKAQHRRGRKAAAPETPTQPAAEQPTRPKRERPPRERKARKPRVHQDLLTVAFRGPLAGHFRELAERHQLSLSALLQDAMLSWEANVADGYQPGTALAEWKAQQGHQGDASE